MGFYFAMGQCAACTRLIHFNPEKVPSLTVNGERQPICKSCHGEWNKIHRTGKGLQPIPLHPKAFEPEFEG